MPNNPIWRPLENCARELTAAGRSPFTRGELISCIRAIDPSIGPDSINPIIQGITDNLNGGAPGAVGKDILHNVARGQFGTRSARPAGPDRSRSSGTALVEKRISNQIAPRAGSGRRGRYRAPPTKSRAGTRLRFSLVVMRCSLQHMILRRVGQSHRNSPKSGRKAARLSYFARGS